MPTTVYYHPVSQPSRAVKWFIERNGIKDVEFKEVDILKKGYATPEYTALTRKYQTIPTLEVDGEVITQSGAVLFYLSKKHGHKDLPKDSIGEARVFEAILHHDGLSRNVSKCVMKALFAKLVNPSLNLEAQKALVDKVVLQESLDFVDGVLSTWKYVAGAHFTLADYLVAAELTQLQFMKAVLEKDCQVESFPNIVRYLADLQSEPGFAAFVAPASMLATLAAAE